MKAAEHVGRIVFGLWFLFSDAKCLFPSPGLPPQGKPNSPAPLRPRAGRGRIAP
jgi:hypothetical protein